MDRQLGDDYDIFIRVEIGSARQLLANSGTEEEFNRAYSRYIADTTSVRVMFYFKKNAQDVYQLDIDQLTKVRSFRERIGKLGLYRDFSDASEIYTLVAEHLWVLIAKEWRVDKWLRRDPDGALQSNPSFLVSNGARKPFLNLACQPA